MHGKNNVGDTFNTTHHYGERGWAADCWAPDLARASRSYVQSQVPQLSRPAHGLCRGYPRDTATSENRALTLQLQLKSLDIITIRIRVL
jgi:hypothetical protein